MRHKRRRATAVTPVFLAAATAALCLMAGATTAASSPPSGTVCIRAWKEAPYRNYGYDHIVAIRNNCDAAVRCSVTTSVSPRRYDVAVAADATKRVLTYRGAPRRAFSARVTCVAAK